MPLTVLVTVPDGLLVFDNPFDKEADEYADSYTVYFLPWSEARRLHGSWEGLVSGIEPLGEVPVQQVAFDETRRQLISEAVVERFANQIAKPSAS